MNIATSSEFRRHWTLFTCSQLDLSAGATVPVDGIPVGFDFEDHERTCTDSTETVEDHRRFIMQYLATRQSLLVAECGYRLCQMRHARASEPVMRAFTQMCGMGFSDVAGPRPSASISIADPLQQVRWSDTNRGRRITIEVSVTNHNPGAVLRYSAGRVAGRGLAEPTSGSIASGATTSATVRVTMPGRRPLRGEPVYIPYRVEVREGGGIQPASVTGTIMIYAATDGEPYQYCTDWSRDLCVRCDVPLSASPATGWCAGMPEGDASITVTGRAVARGTEPERDTWLEIGLDGGSLQTGWCNGGPGSHYRGVACVGPYSGQRGIRQVSMELPHVAVGGTGRLEARVSFMRCTALGPGDTACDLQGTMTFRSLVDLTPPRRRTRRAAR